MTYSENLFRRVRQVLANKQITAVEKKMMGGLCFMVNEKMCIGIDTDKRDKDRLMARIDPDIYEQALTKKGAGPMDITGRPMKGFVFIEEKGISSDKDLEYWVQLALDYNPKAKSSKKSKRS